jgi:hypothetical protein
MTHIFKKIYTNIATGIVVCLLIFLPYIAQAQLVPFVPDECYGKATQDGSGRVSVNCGWEQFVKLGQNIINNAIYLAAMAAVVSIVYAGWLYMSSGDDAGQRKTANKIFGNVIKGIFFTMAAWLLVATMLRFLGVDNAFSLLR